VAVNRRYLLVSALTDLLTVGRAVRLWCWSHPDANPRAIAVLDAAGATLTRALQSEAVPVEVELARPRQGRVSAVAEDGALDGMFESALDSAGFDIAIATDRGFADVVRALEQFTEAISKAQNLIEPSRVTSKG